MIIRSEIRRESREILRRAQPPVLRFAALLLLVTAVLNLADLFCSGTTYESLMNSGPVGIFVYILTGLISLLLEASRAAYCLAARRGEPSAYADLFYGFSFPLRFIALLALESLLVMLGLMLFIVPGFILLYRYRFALYILCEDPQTGVVEALRRSAAELKGFKSELFLLDLSFLGWGLLCSLPLIVWQYMQYYTMLTAGLPDAAVVLVSTLLSFPSVLLAFYRTLSELGLRERIAQYRQQDPGTLF
ncbi:MAG: DUF975 family protein [Oscillospiraceae bacterium]